MRDQRFRARIVAAVPVLTLVAVAVAACGTGPVPEEPLASSATRKADTTGPALPDPKEVERKITRATDPSVPSADKVTLVEGGEQAPQLFDEITRLQKEKPATITVSSVTDGDAVGTALAQVHVVQAGTAPTDVDALLVYSGGQWRLASRFVCGLISNSAYQLPAACQP